MPIDAWSDEEDIMGSQADFRAAHFQRYQLPEGALSSSLNRHGTSPQITPSLLQSVFGPREPPPSILQRWRLLVAFIRLDPWQRRWWRLVKHRRRHKFLRRLSAAAAGAARKKEIGKQ